jgi:hypothetical protein
LEAAWIAGIAAMAMVACARIIAARVGNSTALAGGAG